MNITYTVSITDIIQAVGVGLGFPTAVWGILKLFRKDKDKIEQLNSLRDIAISQNSAIGKMTEQIIELSKQTAQFEYQSIIFKEANDLLKEQIKIQTDALLSDKDHKEKYLELERKKRKSDIRPFFKKTTGLSSQSMFSLVFTNYGGRAYLKGIEDINVNNISIHAQMRKEQEIEKNGTYNFSATANNSYLGNDVPYEITLLFCDEDDNKYKQKIKGVGFNVEISPPEER